MKLEGAKKLWNRYKYGMLVLAVGVVLLVWPGRGVSSPAAESGRPDEDCLRTEARELETRLENILQTIRDVGTVQVLLTLESDGERQLAENTELSYRGSAAAPEDYSRRSEPVLTEGTGGEESIVTRRSYPVYRGALVVCQGGGRAAVRLTVTEAVAALTGLSADRITVAECP